MAEYDNVKFTKGSDIVFIATKRVEENYINKVKVINIPTTDDTPEVSRIINLNRMEDRYTIMGHLSNGKLDATDTKTTAKDKKDLLKVMVAKGSVVTMTYEGTNYEVTVDKYQIIDDARDNKDTMDEEIVYDVIITVVVGEDVI